MFSAASRSAIVRATFKMRSWADRPSRVIAFSSNFSPSAEIAQYLLPNAKAIRLVESGSLLHLLHKWTMRTCFNAQEEIYQASMEEVEQVRAALPAFGRYLGPPCYIRAGVASPICTEGSHFCGVKVWQEFPKIERRI